MPVSSRQHDHVVLPTTFVASLQDVCTITQHVATLKLAQLTTEAGEQIGV